MTKEDREEIQRLANRSLAEFHRDFIREYEQEQQRQNGIYWRSQQERASSYSHRKPTISHRQPLRREGEKSPTPSEITASLKKRCREITKALIKQGKIVPQPCLICGDEAQCHHPDYNDPRTVVWLCKYHHYELHYNELKQQGKNVALFQKYLHDHPKNY